MSRAELDLRRVITVDLAAGTAREEREDAAGRTDFFGGRGAAAAHLAGRAFWRHEPLDPEAPFLIASGLLNGTSWPASSRVHMAFRSPLTGIYGYANAGGSLGPRLAAHEVLILELVGRAERPSIVELGPAGIRVTDAGDLWGRSVSETTSALREGRPSAAVACIGVAGEHGVPLAAVMVDGERVAARCGGGAVLGAKNVKGVVVHGGRAQRSSDAFNARSRAAVERILSTPGISDFSRWGTPVLVAIKNEHGDLPAMNHRCGSVPFADQIDADALESYRVATKGCPGCPIHCGRVSEVRSGPHRSRSAGPEYETVDALGANCLCGDLEALLHANALCNELGLDTISVGATIAFAMECHERGLLDDAEVDLEWGSGDAVVQLVERIARREGIGALLAGGVRAAARELGPAAAPYALHVKGLEIPGQEPRVAKSFGLGHATSNRGADHLYALPTIDIAGLDGAARRFLPEVYPRVLDLGDEATKPALVKFGEDYCAASDALGVCKFTTTEMYALDPVHLADALEALGMATTAASVLEVGERIVNLERILNARFGVDGRADTLPARFTDEPLLTGHGAAAQEHRVESLPAMLGDYYRLRGWGPDGLPTAATLERLGLTSWSAT
jgi:aldehyde:ferredoxin oxidoreductase